ncbi:NusB antitermination factor protein [Dioscorea alata]|uniref:NusB antitermination factor protein n=1 Tax=Dioscorea alata TaxID=55571 RepID=A0ACB7VMM0_DIOAL|nr:NusB antitermination factor protein [Dioscorea alata]
MEAAAISFSSPFNPCNSSLPSSRRSLILSINPKPPKDLIFASNSRNSLRLPPPLAVAEAMEQAVDASGSTPRGNPSKVDRSGRFCSPRAARELALLIAYAACLEGSDPVRLFDRRVNAKRGTEEEASELMLKNEKDSANEAEVLSAPPKVVYNRFVLRLTRDILGAVVDRWNQHVLVIDKIIPQNWKDEPAGRILELCILHIAMAEITVIGTRHQIVINEAVDLAKRFCDGCAPRIINGCLRTFVKDQNTTNNNALQALQSS